MRSKVVCLIIISPVVLLAIGWTVLLLFWSGDPAVYSARDNAKLLAAHLRQAGTGAASVSGLAKGLQLSSHECLCVLEPYANPGEVFRLGDNDIAAQFGAETIQESWVAVMTVDPKHGGQVDRALVQRDGIAVVLPRSAYTTYYSGIWCGPAEAGVDIEAMGRGIKILLREVSYPNSSCAVSSQ